MVPSLLFRHSDGFVHTEPLPLTFCARAGDGILVVDARWSCVLSLSGLPVGGWVSGHAVGDDGSAANDALFVIAQQAGGPWIAQPGGAPLPLARIIRPGCVWGVASPWEVILDDAEIPGRVVESWGALTEADARSLLAERSREWSAESRPWHEPPRGRIAPAPAAPVESLLDTLASAAAKAAA